MNNLHSSMPQTYVGVFPVWDRVIRSDIFLSFAPDAGGRSLTPMQYADSVHSQLDTIRLNIRESDGLWITVDARRRERMEIVRFA